MEGQPVKLLSGDRVRAASPTRPTGILQRVVPGVTEGQVFLPDVNGKAPAASLLAP